MPHDVQTHGSGDRLARCAIVLSMQQAATAAAARLGGTAARELASNFSSVELVASLIVELRRTTRSSTRPRRESIKQIRSACSQIPNRRRHAAGPDARIAESRAGGTAAAATRASRWHRQRRRLHRADLVVPMLKRARAESASDAPALFDAAVSGLARSGADDRVERSEARAGRSRRRWRRGARRCARSSGRRAAGRPRPARDPRRRAAARAAAGRQRVHRAALRVPHRARQQRRAAAGAAAAPGNGGVPARGARRGGAAAARPRRDRRRPAAAARLAFPPQLPQHKLAPHIRHALLAQARVDRPAAVHAVQRALRTGDAPPADAALRAVLVGCCAGGEARAALALLRSLWRHGGRMSSARRAACWSSPPARRRARGAPAPPSSSTRSATRCLARVATPTRSGGGGAARRRSTRRRALAIAEWSAGRLTAAQARDAALERLGQTGVAPRPVLASTLAYMLARDGAMGPAVAILRDYADETAAAPADDAAAPARTRPSSRCSARCAVANTSRRRRRRSS